ncbi:integrase, catalytic region, zinc finger, CCHC-type containing protein, partial [Tanacetum coccineum]
MGYLALVYVYNHFAQLMNDLERNDMHFPIVTINTKFFLNSLQSEWLKYVTQVRLAKRLTVDTFDDLFDYIQQFEKLVHVSRAKKLEKTHNHLALVAHTGSSSRNTSSYYVTHPMSVVDYEDEYQQDDVYTNSEDPLASAMLLLALAITQNFSTPTNNRLHTSSNTRNQAIIQGDRVNIQSRNSGNAGRNNRRAYVQEEIIEGSNVPNETGNVQRTLRSLQETLQLFNATTVVEKVIMLGIVQSQEFGTRNTSWNKYASRMEEIEELSANICLLARIQPVDNTSDAGPSYDYAFISEVQSSSNNENEEQMYPTHTKIINSTIGDDQIDSDIIFDSPNRNVNSGSIEKDTHVPDLCALEQLARNAYQEAEKQQIFAQKVQKQNTTLTSQLELYKERVRVLENINGDNNYLNEFLEADKRAKHFSQQAQSQFVRDRDIIRDLEKQRDKLDLDVKDYKRQNEELQKTHSILKRQMSENEDKYHDTVLDLEAKLKKNVDLILKLGNSLQGMFMLGPKPLSVYDQQLKHGLGYPNPYTLKQAISQCPKLYLASSLGNSEISLHVRDTEDTLDEASKSQQKNSNATPSIPASMPSESPLIIELDKIKNCFQRLSELIQKNCKRASIFYTSPEEIQLNDFCQDQLKPIVNELQFYFEFFKTLFQRDIKEMKDVFESTESELCELEKQNDFLKDQLLEVSLKHEVELSVLLNHECVDNSLHAEIEQLKKKSIEIQEGLQARIKILEKDVQRCEKQSVDFELKLQHEKEKHKWDSNLKNKNTNPLDYSWISKMEKLEDENVSLDFTVQSLIKERDNVKLEYQKLFNSIKKTRSQTQTEMDELIAHVSEKTYAYGAIRAENQNLLFTISELKTRLANVEKGITDASSVRRPINRDSYVKNSVLANSKKPAKKVAVYVRKNKQIDITSENVISNKENVIDVDVANAPKAKTLLYVFLRLWKAILSTPQSYSSGPSTPTNYSLGSSRNVECSNCKHLRGKISVLKATMKMHMHPEQHTVNSAALFHEVLNEMEKLDLEEGCERRYHLLKENFELTLRDAKVYTFHMNHIVATRVWSISFVEFILAPNNSSICYLNSVHQEATILELIGDKLMAMSALEWGKCLSLQRGPSFYLGRFHVAISRIYRKAQDINEAKKELRQAEELCRCVSCKSCQLLLKLEIRKESAKQKRKFVSLSSLPSSESPMTLSMLFELVKRTEIKVVHATHIAELIYIISWVACTKGKSDGDFSIPSETLIATLKHALILSSETPELLKKVAQLLAIMYLPGYFNEPPLSISTNSLTQCHWACFFHELTIGCGVDYLFSLRLSKVYGDDCDQDDNLYRPGELWKAPWGMDMIVDTILPDFKWIVKEFEDGISAVSHLLSHMEGWFGQHEDILSGEPMDDQKNQKINKSGRFTRIEVALGKHEGIGKTIYTSVSSIFYTYQKCYKSQRKAVRDYASYSTLDPFDAYYVINPTGITYGEYCLSEWLKNEFRLEGTCHKPVMKEILEILKTHNLFIYVGHGDGLQHIPIDALAKLDKCASAILMGCYSGLLELEGPYIPKGAPIDYVLAGSPIVVGNLWVVRQTWALEFTKKLLKTFEGELEDEAGIVACLDLARKTYNNLMYRAGTICYGINIFIWRARLDRLPTRSNLANRGVVLDSLLCPICGSVPEDASHFLFQCGLSKLVFRKICRWWDLVPNDMSSFSDWDVWFSGIRLPCKLKLILEGVFYVAWWHIWRFRNQSIFAETPPRRSVLFDDIVSRAFD